MTTPGSDQPVLATIAAFAGLFFGGGAVGDWLARTLAPGSWVAEAVSVFALPLAFAMGLQAWYGLALLGLVPHLVRLVLRPGTPARMKRPVSLPGAWVFLPLSVSFGAIAGVVAGLASPTHPVWIVAPIYLSVGTVHGVVAWRLARRGILMPPETV